MANKTRLCWTAGLAILSLLLSACSGGSSGSGSSGPIRIGVVLPLTGEVAVDGKLESNGIKLAAAQINAAGGINGRKLEVLFEDGACDPAASASAAQKLITRDNVVALDGAFCSSATAAIMPIAARSRVPFLSATSTAADLTAKDNPYFSRSAPTEDLMSRQAVPYLVNAKSITKAYIIAFNDDYGLSYLQANKSSLEKAGVQVAGTATFGANTQDFAPLITQFKQSGADALFVGADTGPTASLFKQLAQFGVAGTIRVSAQVAASQQFISLATPAAAEGIYATAPYLAQSKAPRNGAFVRQYMAKYGSPPESGAAGGYDAMYVLAGALKRSKGQGGDALQTAIRATDMQTVRGRLTFDSNGQGFADVFLAQIRNGKVTLVKQLAARG